MLAGNSHITLSMDFLIGPFLLIILLVAFYTSSTADEYPHLLQSSLNGTRLNMEWRVDETAGTIEFQISLFDNQPRDVLIGFSDHGFIPHTDFCFYKVATGQLVDGWIEKFGPFPDDLDKRLKLRRDFHQDCELTGRGQKELGPSWFSFKRRLSTCDSRDYRIEGFYSKLIKNGTTNLLLALSALTAPTPIRKLKSPSVVYEMRHTQLLQQPRLTMKKRTQEGPLSAMRWDILSKNITVPQQLTTYWCTVVELSEQIKRRKHHVIKYEPVITEGNEDLVHHMEVFHCQTPTPIFNGDCNDERKPTETKGCSRVMAAWAMGAGAVTYPDEAGMPIGGEGFIPYLMVEIHYNNVDGLSNRIDNSGMRIIYTPKLRSYDAGIMELGLIYSDANSIPPRQRHFSITGFCLAECTAKFPSRGINVFASQLHAHLTGRKLWTSHYRNGTKIGEINRDNHYSPHWQHIQRLSKPARILPGDVLTTTCVYDTSERTNWTWGGYGIEDEMCVNYLHYYPASEVEVCKSAIDNSTLRTFFAKLGVADAATLSIQQNYLNVTWTPAKIELLAEIFHVSEINMACLDHSGTAFSSHPTNWTRVPRPDLELEAKRFDRIPGKWEECLAVND